MSNINLHLFMLLFRINLSYLTLNNSLYLIAERDAVAAIVTFLVSVIFGVELGLLVGALFSLIFFLRSPARPKIEVIQCKVKDNIVPSRSHNISANESLLGHWLEYASQTSVGICISYQNGICWEFVEYSRAHLAAD